jgi:hypothetical protein
MLLIIIKKRDMFRQNMKKKYKYEMTILIKEIQISFP